MIGGGGRYDRAASRDMQQTCREVARARHTERPLLQVGHSDNRRREAAQHLVGVAVNPRCSIWLVVLQGVCALSLSEGRCQGLRSLFHPSTYHPSTYHVYLYYQRSKAQVLCARVRPNHSNSSTRLQHQQQQCSVAWVVPSLGAAAGTPYSCCGKDVVTSLQSSHSSSTTSSTTFSGDVMSFNVIKPSGHYLSRQIETKE